VHQARYGREHSHVSIPGTNCSAIATGTNGQRTLTYLEAVHDEL